jgi:DNA-directed RNA polymerase specialized sigma24 family protein
MMAEMTDSIPDNSQTRQNAGTEDFARFLESLSHDADEAGRLYIRLHKKLVGFFNLKGVSDPMKAADDTIERATRKIADGAPVPDADKYCLGIARNIAKERWRRAQRENHVFLNFVEQLSTINRGRAFYSSPDRLGEYILADYIRNRRKFVH